MKGNILKINIIGFILVALFFSFTSRRPNVLIIGDSISIGYTTFLKKNLSEEMNISHNPGNAQHTGIGLKNIYKWIGNEDWDIIQFNWGLWDLCYRDSNSKEEGRRDKLTGKITYSVKEYEANLDSIVKIIRKISKAKLIFVTTTYVPEDEVGRFQVDVEKYNAAALRIMKKYNVTINDIYQRSIKIHKKYGLGNDNVHYTDKGYEELSKQIIPTLRRVAKQIK